MLKSIFNLTLVSALWLAAPAFAQTVAPASDAPKLVAILKSPDASRKEKADACRQLAVIGTAEAVPALAALLGDEQLNHMARYALEPIPSPAADDALRAALGQVQGRPLVGVIGSLGVRRDAKAAAPLAKLLDNSDPDVAQAAARALGKIATPEAAKALQAALPGVAAASQLAFCEGALRCAESFAAKGDKKSALAIYNQMRGLPVSHQARTAATRGAILQDPQGLKLLAESLPSQDYVVFAGAIRAAQELRDPKTTTTLISGLTGLSADRQVVVLQTIGKRADLAAVPALAELAKAGDKPVRLAAIRALAEIGQPATLPTFRQLLRDPDRELARAAQESFASLQGQEVEAAVLALLGSADKAQQLAGVELVGRRRVTGSVPALLKAARESDVSVRPAALKQVGELGTPETVPAVIEILQAAKAAEEIESAEQALGALCAKAPNPEACVGQLTGAMAQAQPAQKAALLRVLSTVGGPQALQAVRGSVGDANAAVRDAAIRALGAWKTADAAPDLLALAKSAADPGQKMLCLRSYLGLAVNAELPGNQRLSMCREAAGLVQAADEKKLLLAALGTINAPEALDTILPFLADTATRDEAGAATLSIAERLLKPRNAKVSPKLTEALEKVAQSTANADLAQRAKALLEQARKKAGGA